MKKVLVALFLLSIVSFPVVSSAGTAYLPLYIVNGNAQTFQRTAIQISSIGVAQEVTLTLYKFDGGLLSGQSITIYNGTNANPIATTTDLNGQIKYTISANSTLHVVVNPNVTNGTAPDFNQGYGKIEGSNLGLVASAFIRDLNSATSTEAAYQRSITINGGNPF